MYESTLENEYENKNCVKELVNFGENCDEIELIRNIDDFVIEDHYFNIKDDNEKDLIIKRPGNGLFAKLEALSKEDSFNICKGNDLHNKKYEYYCKLCKKNICSKCVINHNHKQYLFNFDQHFHFYLKEGEKLQNILNHFSIIDEPHILNLAYELFKNGKYNNYMVFSIIKGYLDYLRDKIEL